MEEVWNTAVLLKAQVVTHVEKNSREWDIFLKAPLINPKSSELFSHGLPYIIKGWCFNVGTVTEVDKLQDTHSHPDSLSGWAKWSDRLILLSFYRLDPTIKLYRFLNLSERRGSFHSIQFHLHTVSTTHSCISTMTSGYPGRLSFITRN